VISTGILRSSNESRRQKPRWFFAATSGLIANPSFTFGLVRRVCEWQIPPECQAKRASKRLGSTIHRAVVLTALKREKMMHKSTHTVQRIPGYRFLRMGTQLTLTSMEFKGLGSLTPSGLLTDDEIRAQIWLVSPTHSFVGYGGEFCREVDWVYDFLAERLYPAPRCPAHQIDSLELCRILRLEALDDRTRGSKLAPQNICHGAVILSAFLCAPRVWRPRKITHNPQVKINLGHVRPINPANWVGFKGLDSACLL
jgi:hypothetical protein